MTLGASYILARVLANQIYGVTTTDPWTFAAAAFVLATIGTAACLLPANRALKVDPMIAIRQV